MQFGEASNAAAPSYSSLCSLAFIAADNTFLLHWSRFYARLNDARMIEAICARLRR
jgi:hypothetical protein